MLDTIIVTANEDTFSKVFISELCWYPLRLDDAKIPLLKWIAVYRNSPTSALTHYAEVLSIGKFKETGRYVISIGEPKTLGNPLFQKAESRFTMQGQRYTTLEKILQAKKFEDLRPWL